VRRLIWWVLPLIAALPIEPACGESALSSLGYGLPQSMSNTRAVGMGMVSLAMPDTIGLNLLSPAAWDGEPTARFGFGGKWSFMRLEDNRSSDANDHAYFEGVAMAVPLGEGHFVGVSMSPYTRMLYEWKADDPEGWAPSVIRQQGEGGFSQAMVAFSARLTKEMRLGLAVRPIFGKVDQHWRRVYNSYEFRSPGISISDRFHGFGWALSGQWVHPHGWSAGMSLFSPVKVGVERETVILVDGDYQQSCKGELAEKYDLPWDVSLGFGYRFGSHLAGFEAQWQGWDNTDQPPALTGAFMDAFRLGLGWEWSPEYRPLDSFWRAFTYRSGFYMQEHYVRSMSGHRSKRLALSGGLSIPYYGGRSRMDFAIEIGWIGDRSRNGVAEREIKFTLGINHSEKWFIGRRERSDKQE